VRIERRKKKREGGSGQAAVFGSLDKLPIGRLTLVCAEQCCAFWEPHETSACSSGVIFF